MAHHTDSSTYVHQYPELPEIHPGCPGHLRLTVCLWLIGESAKAWHVEIPATGAAAWLPKSQALIVGETSDFHPRQTAEGVTHEHLKKISLPVWLYRRIAPQQPAHT